MSSARRSFLWMGALSVVTLLLGALRELVIARDLQASGAADVFFRGLVVVTATRGFGVALFRARWIPVGPAVQAAALLRAELRTCATITGLALVALAVILGPGHLFGLEGLAFAVSVVLAGIGSPVRALAERAGHERLGFALDWAIPLGAIAGATVVGRGALGPAAGITLGLGFALAALVPTVFRPNASDDPARAVDEVAVDAGRTRWLVLDTLTYVNLGLFDALASMWLFDAGEFALLNYAYLFVNAALVVPSAAATVVALRIAATDRSSAPRRLRRWALIGGAVVGAGMLAVWWGLGLDPVAARVNAAAGWALVDGARPVVLLAVPFAALRLANTVGRQLRVAHDPAGLAAWDIAGLSLRAVVLVAGVGALGVCVAPLGHLAAELVQLGGWVRWGGRPRA